MANKQRGYVSIQLDKARNLRFTTNGLAELEDVLGHPVTQMNAENVGIKTLRSMLWAALLHESPDLTIHAAGALMDEGDMQEISAKLSDAFELAFGKNENNAKNKVSGLSGVGVS